MDFTNFLDDTDIAIKSEARCAEIIRKAICMECGRPKDLMLMYHTEDLKSLPITNELICHGDVAVDWDSHVLDIANKFFELGAASWQEVRPVIQARGGLVSQAGVLAILRGSHRQHPTDAILDHMMAINLQLFTKMRSIAPNDASILRIYEILTFCYEALRRPEGERLLSLARKLSPKTREAHAVIWQLATQECYSKGQYEDALRCLFYGMEPRDGVLPQEGEAAAMTVEEVLVLSLSSQNTVSGGFNLARVAQRLGKPGVAALHAYRCVVYSSRLGWRPPVAAERKEMAEL
eukprot:Blabericola_migrator_1__13207@NODE_911_length_6105_cov_137_973501_g636_i0_p4_GENE_NODE_911_length_6105_cov_137_973501_g636_i0NODE_911_length_6105_cov_137_973501_g636_i0_p4_ORF_typecomplete_len292_score26_71TPR_3/PF07720_12/0_19TPR_MalT/PF17874_1/2e03TPR_MalT/PF17874_1/0_28TPR_15/PF13429_6/0_71TPR_15/PF13429_6/8_8e02_NODE_911_length_6105_cov_137_973501_g636_i018262701